MEYLIVSLIPTATIIKALANDYYYIRWLRVRSLGDKSVERFSIGDQVTEAIRHQICIPCSLKDAVLFIWMEHVSCWSLSTSDAGHSSTEAPWPT